MIMLQQLARISRNWENSFINQYLNSKHLLILIFISITISTWDKSLSPFSRQLWINDITRNFGLMTSWRPHLRFWKNSSINKLLTSNYILLLILIFLSTLGHEISIWILLTNFGLITSPQRVKPSKFWDFGFKNKYFTSNFSLLLHLKFPFTF